jgi:hypothetical protein
MEINRWYKTSLGLKPKSDGDQSTTYERNLVSIIAYCLSCRAASCLKQLVE